MKINTWVWGIVAAAIALLVYDYFAATDALSSSLADILNPGSDTSDASGGTGDYSGVAGTILNALASFENVASQHNNPGGICGSFDSSGNCLGPATYDSIESGIAAGESKISNWIAANPGITVYQFVKKWSGGAGDVLTNYVNKVAGELGLDPSDPIADAGGSETADYGGDDGSDAADA